MAAAWRAILQTVPDSADDELQRKGPNLGSDAEVTAQAGAISEVVRKVVSPAA